MKLRRLFVAPGPWHCYRPGSPTFGTCPPSWSMCAPSSIVCSRMNYSFFLLLLSFLRWYFFWSYSRGLDFSSMCSAPLFFSTVTLCLVTEIPNRWPFLAYLLELILLYG